MCITTFAGRLRTNVELSLQRWQTSRKGKASHVTGSKTEPGCSAADVLVCTDTKTAASPCNQSRLLQRGSSQH